MLRLSGNIRYDPGMPDERTRKKILIVDDDEAFAKSVGRMFVKAGYDALIAADGMAGTAMAVKNAPDLIIIDIRMPAGDGHTLGRRIRENVATCSIPILVVSGGAHAQDISEAKEWGAAAFLLKPVDPDQLRRTVEEILCPGNERSGIGPSVTPVPPLRLLKKT